MFLAGLDWGGLRTNLWISGDQLSIGWICPSLQDVPMSWSMALATGTKTHRKISRFLGLLVWDPKRPPKWDQDLWLPGEVLTFWNIFDPHPRFEIPHSGSCLCECRGWGWCNGNGMCWLWWWGNPGQIDIEAERLGPQITGDPFPKSMTRMVRKVRKLSSQLGQLGITTSHIHTHTYI